MKQLIYKLTELTYELSSTNRATLSAQGEAATPGWTDLERCYAWSFSENGEAKYTTVLEIPPVDSAESAVKVAIASKGK